jgi:ferredoxin--NADP+ reductase
VRTALCGDPECARGPQTWHSPMPSVGRAMSYVITNGCCSDASCIPVCPVQCIRPRPGDPDFTTTEQLYIDPATCIDCGACMDECPVEAIHPEWDVPDELADYLDINAAHFETNPISESAPPDPIRRRLPQDRTSLSVAVVGSGPAGCYAADELSSIKGVTVTVLDQLPTPFGLVRSGVAPDHGSTKLIMKRFGAVLARPNVECLFNVAVGRDVTIQELLEHHHAVIWAGGAGDDRRLGIRGEELEGSVSAREFVGWYNGHPDFADRTFDLHGQRVVVVGNGNVALDVARVLAQPPGNLAPSDIADHALKALQTSTVTEVLVTARRGPEFAAYTTGELTGLDHTEGLVLNAEAVEVHAASERLGHGAQILKAAAERDVQETERRVTLRFGLRPEAIHGVHSVESIDFRRTDGTVENIDATLVVRAIGYRGTAVDSLPFDETTGTLPHVSGSVMDPATGESVVGVYCSGWIKRGATGIIGTNKMDSAETVDSLLHDFASGRLSEPEHHAEHLHKLILERQPDLVDKQGWVRIDQAERRAGREAGRTRLKLVARTSLVAASQSPQ